MVHQLPRIVVLVACVSCTESLSPATGSPTPDKRAEPSSSAPSTAAAPSPEADRSGQLIVQVSEPSVRATVQLSGPNGEIFRRTAPFSHCGLAPGPWRLEARLSGHQMVRATVLVRPRETSSTVLEFRAASRLTVRGSGSIRWTDLSGDETTAPLPLQLYRSSLDGIRLRGVGSPSGEVAVALRGGAEMTVRWGKPGLIALGRTYAVPEALTVAPHDHPAARRLKSRRQGRKAHTRRWFDVAPVNALKELRWKVRSVVVHAHGEATTEDAVSRWLKARTTRHFAIETDGTVVQILDVAQQTRAVGSRLDETAIHVSVAKPEGRLTTGQRHAVALLLGTLSGMFPRVQPAFPDGSLGRPLVDPRAFRGWMSLDQVLRSERVLSDDDQAAIVDAYRSAFQPRPGPKDTPKASEHTPTLGLAALAPTSKLEVTSPSGVTRTHHGPMVVCKPEPGTWSVAASAPGFASDRRELSIRPRTSTLVTLPLKRTGHLTLEGPQGQVAELRMPSGQRKSVTLPARLNALPEGLYRVAIDRSARQLPVYKLAIQVDAGKHARLAIPDVNDPNVPFIRVAGAPYPLPSAPAVRRYDMPGAMSFYRAQARLGKRGRVFAQRRLPRGDVVETLEQASKVTRMVVIHADVMPDTQSMFTLLVSRHLSTHFGIDWDGTIYQLLDPVDAAFAAAEVNPYSIHIDLNNTLPNLVKKPGASSIPSGHPKRREMAHARFKRPRSERQRINGREVMSYGYNAAQYHSLTALLQLLTGLFERIEPRFPRDAEGQVPQDYFDAAEDFEGVVAHWHLTPRRWDPGPGFEWQRLRDDLSGFTIRSREDPTTRQP